MRRITFSATCPIDNLLVLGKYISLMTMDKTISKKRSVKDSTEKPPPGDKTFGLDPEIRFYAIEDGDETGNG